MKITISPSAAPEGPAGGVSCTVAVEHPYDDLNVTEAVRLMRSALIAWGFAESNIDEAIGRE